MSFFRVEIIVTIPLPEPVSVPFKRQGGQITNEQVLSVEWFLSGTRIVCKAIGAYRVWAHYAIDEVPDWVPACPPSIFAVAAQLDAESRASYKEAVK